MGRQILRKGRNVEALLSTHVVKWSDDQTGKEGPHHQNGLKDYLRGESVLRIRIRIDPYSKSPPGSGSAWRDADPDPGGKKA